MYYHEIYYIANIFVIEMQLSDSQLTLFSKNGYLVLKDLFSSQEIELLKTWAQEVHDWKATPDSEFMPYEV